MENKPKKLNFWQIWALGVGAVVGDGIFLLVSQAAQAAGSAAALAYFIAGVLIMLICMAVCELAVAMPGAGSIYHWSKEVISPAVGTLTGLAYVGMNVIFFGSVSIAAGSLTNSFYVIGDNEQVSAIIWTLIIIVVVTAIALLGGEITGTVQLALVAVLVGIMIVFIFAGIFTGKIDPANYKPFSPFGGKGIWAAIGMGIYAYMGPLALLTAGDEVKNIKTFPKAMFWAFVTFIGIYTLAIVVLVGMVSYTEYGAMESPFTTAASMVFGKWAGFIINLGAWIAAVTCLIGEVFCASRLLRGMAKEKAIPQIFAKTDKKGNPWFGVLFSAVIAIIIAVIGSLGGALAEFYNTVCTLGSVCGALNMTICLTSSCLYKKKYPKEWENLCWHMPLRKLTYPLAFVGCIVLFIALYAGNIKALIPSVILVVLIILFYFLYSAKHIDRVENK